MCDLAAECTGFHVESRNKFEPALADDLSEHHSGAGGTTISRGVATSMEWEAVSCAFTSEVLVGTAASGLGGGLQKAPYPVGFGFF